MSDAEVFEAAQRVMMRVGPGDLSLAEIAGEAGVTAGALVQRFGSKRDLMLALMAEWSAGTPGMLEGFRSARASGVERVLWWGECMGAMGETPGALANHLAYLQMDLTDPEFRAHMLASAEATRASFREWLDEAVEAGELAVGTDTAELARLVEAAIGGSLLSWAVYQEGTAGSWVRRDLEALLRPHRAGA